MLIRSILAALTAMALVVPAFADETTTAVTSDQGATQATTTTNDQGTAQTTTTTATDDQGSTTTTQVTTETKVDLNKATIKELTKVKGITPAKARAIVSYRKKNGDFKSTDDLKNVKGFNKMSEEKLKAILDQLTIS